MDEMCWNPAYRTCMSKDRALIFDMDGVLVDSEPLHLMAYQQLLGSFGHRYTEDENRQFLGRRDEDCCHELVSRLRLQITAERFGQQKEKILVRLIEERAMIRPGVMNVLHEADRIGIPLAVASSAKLATIHVVTEKLGIKRFFRTLTSGDEVKLGKPAPDVFLLAAERLETAPDRCLVIEDTVNGLTAARAAGMKCVVVPCEATRHQDHSLADCVLSSLDEFDVVRWFQAGVL